MENTVEKPIFRDLTGEDPDPEATQIESLCMNCEKNGMTRLLLTKIPFYKEVVLMSFSCDHCGFQNNEIQSGAEIQSKGCKVVLKVVSQRDLNRKIVKTDFSSVRIEELDFEIPAQSQKGEVTTVEGIVMRCITGLEQDQEKRRQEHPEAAEKIDAFVGKLKDLLLVETPFTLIIDDASGDIHVENPEAPKVDSQVTVSYYIRNKDQNEMLGIYDPEEVVGDSVALEKEKEIQTENNEMMKPIAEDAWPLEELHGEVFQFATNCPNCASPCETNMKLTTIPHFKEVVIMATVCDRCGNRTNEVKSGGGIEEKGVRIEVVVESKEDFSRDVLKSENCSLLIRELEVEVGPYALGGRFTTIEGILTAMRDQLSDNSAMFRDSADQNDTNRLDRFLEVFDDVLKGNKKITVVLDDPTGNSYVQTLSDDGKLDKNLRIIKYHRSHEQNEELGLNDMKTENYEDNN